MKKSNKLLIGLLVFVVLGLIVVNLVFYQQVKQKTIVKPQVRTTVNDSTSDVSDSLDMEKAINNE